MKAEVTRCPLCNAEVKNTGYACSSCPFAKGCNLVCCSSCGYGFVDESRFREKWSKRIKIQTRIRKD